MEKPTARGWMRLNYPDPFVPFAEAFPTGSGKLEFVSDRMAQCGLDPVPGYAFSPEMSQRGAALACEFPLALITPADHHLLNIFANTPKQRRRSGAAPLLIRPDDAAPRCITTGDEVRVANVRGTLFAVADVSGRVRPAWWPAATADGLPARKRARRSILLSTIGTRTWALVRWITTTAYASTRWTDLKRTCRDASGEKFGSCLDSRTSRDEGRRVLALSQK